VAPGGLAVKPGSLECRAVSHGYGVDAASVLKDVSIEMRVGEFVSIVGASGSGKTTLLRILAGLVTPSAGSVFSNGTDVTGRSGIDRAMVFQADRLYPWRTALRNVTFGLELKGHSREAAERRAQEALALVGLPRHGSAYPHQLSGGMRQRVNVARALAVDPDFLLMDEPFSALDTQTREMMQVELLRVWDAARTGVMFVTHMIEEAVYLSDRVLVLGSRPGRVRREVAISSARPRGLAIKRQPEFQGVCDLIWREIEEEVRVGMALEQELAKEDRNRRL
jgi:NitT/TauT family transport system ATP-binding protein